MVDYMFDVPSEKNLAKELIITYDYALQKLKSSKLAQLQAA
jgi:hypothetical protein